VAKSRKEDSLPKTEETLQSTERIKTAVIDHRKLLAHKKGQFGERKRWVALRNAALGKLCEIGYETQT